MCSEIAKVVNVQLYVCGICVVYNHFLERKYE